MDIKSNIKGEVLSVVAEKMNVTEDLLIQMISSDLHNDMVTTFVIIIGIALVAIFSGLVAYFQFKKSDGNDSHEFFGTVSTAVCFICLVIIFFTTIFSEAYEKQFEVIYNHEYAIIKEINKMYDEIVNPVEEVESQQ